MGLLKERIKLSTMIRTMLYENSIPKHLWAEVVNTT